MTRKSTCRTRTNRSAAAKEVNPMATLHAALTTRHGALFKSDCLALLPAIHDESIDCVFADPPFNLGKVYGPDFNDKLSDEEYLAWCKKWLLESIRVLKPGGSLC
ncbi:MAG: DNA methyltransferase [Bacillota bacterium]